MAYWPSSFLTGTLFLTATSVCVQVFIKPKSLSYNIFFLKISIFISKAFSYQMAASSLPHNRSVLDSVFVPSAHIKLSGFMDEGNSNTNCAPQFYPSNVFYNEVPVEQTNLESSCLDYSSKVALSDDEPSVTKKQSTESSTAVDKLESGEHVTQKVIPMDKKRKNKNGSSLSSSKSKDARESRTKKQKKSNNGLKNEDEEKKLKSNEIDQERAKEDPSKGYIHVRARRGQATDSHSLAERVRREKISERMKMLQKLVPGCDKVTGKALMLDEIINYVQSLQNQVEFLSMKLASTNPMFYDFAMDLDSLVVRPERLSTISSPAPQSSPAQPTVFADTHTVYSNATNYTFLDSSTSLLLQQAQRPNALFHDNGCLLWDVEDQRQNFLSPTGLSNNLCSFN